MRKNVHFYSNSFCLFVLLFLGVTAFSQSTDASISGRITGPDIKAVSGVTIAIKNESTGFTSQSISNKDGRYIFRQLPLGSPYTVTVSSRTYTSQIKNNYSLNQGDLLVVDFQLESKTTSLQEVIVQANKLASRIDRFGASTAISAKTIQQIPAQNRKQFGEKLSCRNIEQQKVEVSIRCYALNKMAAIGMPVSIKVRAA